MLPPTMAGEITDDLDLFPFRNPNVKVKPEIVCFELEEEKEVDSAPSKIKVKVNSPFRIVVDGEPHVGGDVVEVDDSERTRFWRSARWVTAVEPEKAAAK